MLAAVAGLLASGVVVTPGAPVVVVGNGPVQLLAGRIAAIRGYETTLACAPQFIEQNKQFLWDEAYPEGSLPLKMMPIAGDAADADAIKKACNEAEGLIVAFDAESQLLPESALNVFLPPSGSNVKRISVMSRYLNGAGMGFTAKAAKLAANAEIWCADSNLVAQYKTMEAQISARAREAGASVTVVRAGTLKGGASGDALSGGTGEPTFLNPEFYKMGQQDVVNWRLLVRSPAPDSLLSACTDTCGGSHEGYMLQGELRRSNHARARFMLCSTIAHRSESRSPRATPYLARASQLLSPLQVLREAQAIRTAAR